jgi:protein TonB
MEFAIQDHLLYRANKIPKNRNMKTKTFTSEAVTIEDIVFENRNKVYGAYALNKKHHKYLLIAFAISLAGFTTAVAVPFFKAVNNPGQFGILDRHVTTVIGKIEPETEIPAVPLPPPPSDHMVQQAVFKIPDLVDEPTAELGFMPNNEAMEKTINIAPPEIITNHVEPPAEEINEINMPGILSPQEQASFMNGDLNDFIIWVKQNIVYPPLAAQLGISGKVIIEFCVSSKGEVMNVHVLRSVDASLDNESIKVISSSPKWRAARQGGIPVKQHFVIPVVFMIQK